MDYVITGGAGYIGGHIVDSLAEGNNVTVIDDLSSGHHTNPNATLLKVDLSNGKAIDEVRLERGCTMLHLAANPNVRTSMLDVRRHFEQDVTGTLNALELARRHDASKFVFASSSVVYGEARKVPTPEKYRTKPVSNYGLFKLFGEELVERYSTDYGIKAVSLRLANVIGGRTSHGIIPDFMEKLRSNPARLEILGDGKQRKSYVYINDVIHAVTLLSGKTRMRHTRVNVGSDDSISVDEIAEIICKNMGLSPEYAYRNNLNGRGWKGDVRVMLLDNKKLRGLGWSPEKSSREAVETAVNDLLHGSTIAGKQ